MDGKTPFYIFCTQGNITYSHTICFLFFLLGSVIMHQQVQLAFFVGKLYQDISCIRMLRILVINSLNIR